jgi:type I restriction enzyme R subunit
MSNFAFLQNEWGMLFESARKAESAVMSDPRSSCFYARYTLEQAVNWLYKNDQSFGIPYDNNIGALLAHSAFRQNVPDKVYDKAKFIQKMGNVAVHSQRPIKQFDALNIIKELFHFLHWFAQTYTKGSPAKIPDTFDEKIPQTTVTKVAEPAKTLEQIQKLANVLAEKDKALAEKEQKLLSTDEELQKLRKQIEEIKAKNAKVPDDHDYSEAQTRDLFIDLLLKEAGWKLDKKEDIEYPVTGMPYGSGEGFVDYVLWGDNGLPLGIVEAKRTKKDPMAGRQQSKLYADCLEKMTGQRPVIFYSNGYETYLWDDLNYPPREVQGFYTKNELQLMIQRRKTKKDPSQQPINKAITDRYYQEECIRSIVEHLKSGHRKALCVQATGSGKTRTVIALCDLLMKCNYVKKILFLCDRTALVRQAVTAFKKHLPESNPINLLSDKEAQDSRVVVSTYHTMMGLIDEVKGGEEKRFGVGHFDLVIIDEAHRSVYQKFGAIFEYFDSLLVGLTATPKDEVDKNTYRLFELEDGVPTYAYDLDQAVADGFLVPPNPISVPLKFQREGIKYDDLSDEEKEEWDALEWDEEGGEPPDAVSAAALNKWLFNKDTVEKVLAHLMENGLKVKGGDRLGKTIIFAKNHKHAEFIAEIFNKNYPHYKGHFARVIDNYENYAQSLIDDFSKKDSDPHIAISVDMLDTGIDVPEVVNLVFFKMLQSKTKFIQMIGRGTRLCPDLFGIGQHKEYFNVFDYCQNFEFFNQNPEGKEGNAPEPLGKQLFKTRLALISAYRPKKQEKAELQELEQGLLDLLYAEVAGMNEDNFIVRPKRKYLHQYKDKSKWQQLTEGDLATLEKQIAGLPSEIDEEEETAKRFDLLTMKMQLAVLEAAPIFNRLRDQVMEIGGILEEKSSVPAVNAQMPLILQIQSEEYWQDITLPMIENVRRKLRDLIKFIDYKEQKVVYSDFEDEIGKGVKTELVGLSSGFNVMQYRKKVEQFVRSHENHIVIHKIKTADQLTPLDLQELEKFFFEADETGSRKDFEKAFGKQESLSLFIRKLVGLDRDAAKKAFGKYLDGKACTTEQIRFVNFIVDYLTKNGVMEPESLYEQPFTDINDKGLDGVFKEDQADDVVRLLENIKESATAELAG